MSQGEDTGQEKTHEPTQRKLDQAREKGDVPRSTDASAAAAYLGFLAGALAMGPEGVSRAAAPLAALLGRADWLEGRLLGPAGPDIAGALIGAAAAGLAPILLLPVAAAGLALAAQRAFAVSAGKIAPKLSRISPIAGAKNKFGLTGLVAFAKSVVKMAAIAVALALFLAGELDAIIGAARAAPAAAPALMLKLMLALLAVVAALSVAIAGIDLVWQRFDHARKLRMSHQEIKEEVKQAEGDPQVKGQRRRRAEEIATNRMLADVPGADVVIVNPTHYAVALKWSRRRGEAPVCVAKGVDEVARRIREAAAAAGVPLHRDPPTARALHDSTEVGAEIAPDHYRAVAAAIRFAERMRARARDGGFAPGGGG